MERTREFLAALERSGKGAELRAEAKAATTANLPGQVGSSAQLGPTRERIAHMLGDDARTRAFPPAPAQPPAGARKPPSVATTRLRPPARPQREQNAAAHRS